MGWNDKTMERKQERVNRLSHNYYSVAEVAAEQ